MFSTTRSEGRENKSIVKAVKEIELFCAATAACLRALLTWSSAVDVNDGIIIMKIIMCCSGGCG